MSRGTLHDKCERNKVRGEGERGEGECMEVRGGRKDEGGSCRVEKMAGKMTVNMH